MPSPPRVFFVHTPLRARDYQDRPELEEVCDWWRSGGAGVCALTGIGGAGKTAAADRFLRLLPEIMPPEPGLPKDHSLPVPEGVFVFSFYESPSPEAFFAQLAAWLGRKPSPRPPKQPSYQHVLQLLADAPRLLLVFDGLERVQADGTRGDPLGSVLDGHLRDLLQRAAEGQFRRLAVLATTRFRLFHPLVRRSPHYWPVVIDRLAPESAVALLRARGVKGTTRALRDLAAEQGNHALTVDLMGGFVARYCGGDPRQLPAEPLQQVSDHAARDAAVDPEAAAILEQDRRFARLIARYQNALQENDPIALAVLERMSLFRLAVDVETFASIFTGSGKERLSGPELARLEQATLEGKLSLLADMRLLERNATGQFTAHPAVRDAFLRGLDNEVVKQGHEAVGRALQASLGGRPGKRALPSDPASLDLLEEVIHHLLASGRNKDAWNVYRTGLGAFPHLGGALGEYARGERVCRLFAGGMSAHSAPPPPFMAENVQAVFLNEWALYLRHLGQLDAAAVCFRGNIRLREAQESPNLSIGLENYADLLLLQGRLGEAAEAGMQSQLLEVKPACYSPSHDHAIALLGRTREALGLYERAREEEARDFAILAAFLRQPNDDGKLRMELHLAFGLYYSTLLGRLGRIDEAVSLLGRNITACSSFKKEEALLAKLRLALADLLARKGELAEANGLLREVRDWAIARDASDVRCWSALVGARVALAEADRWRAGPVSTEATVRLRLARERAEEGLQIARDAGFGIHHIDLLTLRGRVSLLAGDVVAAERDARIALFGLRASPDGAGLEAGDPQDDTSPADERGVFPHRAAGLPVLLAATHPECGYAWGEGDARQLLAEALLLRAVRGLGRGRFLPTREDALAPAVACSFRAAKQQLDLCLKLREKMKDSARAVTEQVLDDLRAGILTGLPLAPAKRDSAGVKVVSPNPEVTTMAPSRRPRKGSVKQTSEKVSAREPTDFLIMTALPEERDAVLSKLPGYRQLPPDGEDVRVHYAVELPVTFSNGATGSYRLAVTSLLGMGRVQSANATNDAIRRWQPRYILLVGIAGGVSANGVAVGDLLLSEQVVDFELQKLTRTGPQIRWEVHRADPRLLGFAKSLRESDWLPLVDVVRPAAGKPSCHFGPVATGDKVVANDLLRKYHRRDVWPKLIGVEMEAGGVALAAFQAARPPGFFMVRCASDLADPDKDAPEIKNWRPYACDVAAAYTIGLLRRGPVPLTVE